MAVMAMRQDRKVPRGQFGTLVFDITLACFSHHWNKQRQATGVRDHSYVVNQGCQCLLLGYTQIKTSSNDLMFKLEGAQATPC